MILVVLGLQGIAHVGTDGAGFFEGVVEGCVDAAEEGDAAVALDVLDACGSSVVVSNLISIDIMITEVNKRIDREIILQYQKHTQQ